VSIISRSRCVASNYIRIVFDPVSVGDNRTFDCCCRGNIVALGLTVLNTGSQVSGPEGMIRSNCFGQLTSTSCGVICKIITDIGSLCFWVRSYVRADYVLCLINLKAELLGECKVGHAELTILSSFSNVDNKDVTAFQCLIWVVSMAGCDDS
jgi:hypothetical protein